MSTPGALDKMDFYILLALAEKPLHGYAISEQITVDSGGSAVIAPTNLYRYLYRLEDAGMITPVATSSNLALKRKSYQLTTAGSRRLKSEALHLADATELAAQRLS